ncbi:MAG: glycoside hydrolase family 127 protein [Alistipes sp.]|nr:glycoside hydrolase family 127 protein [Alistipes sp.]
MKRLFFAAVSLLTCVSVLAQNSEVKFVERPDTESKSSNYVGNRAPLAPAAAIKLPLGSIHAEGWLGEVFERQCNGLAGHLGEISAWLKKEGNAWLETEGHAGWEEVPYWLRGYSDMAYMKGDEKMLEETKLWIEAILASQREDGWFGPLIYNEKTGNDYWPNMLVLFTLQNYYEFTGDKRVIDFMTKYFKYEMAQPDGKIIASYWENMRGGDNLYSVYWLYNRTGESWLLDLATKLDRCTANWKMGNTLPNWHVVNIAQCFRQPATYAMQSKDPAHTEATYFDFKHVRDIYGQVPGGMYGADENARKGYDDPRQGAETCSFAEQMTSDGILTCITGDVMWADNAEDVMFNSFLAAFTPDMKSLRYITSPNMVLADGRNHHPGIDNAGPFLMMNPFSSRCCQHNHSHGLPYYIGNMVMATNDNGLLANLYGSATINAKVGKKVGVELKMQSNYPFEEVIRFDVNPAKAVAFPLYLRVPAWCEGASVTINGQQHEAIAENGGYIKITRKWQKGDKVELALPMRLTMREWVKNKKSVSINYGPLTFSLLIKENYIKKGSKDTAIWDSRWQEGVDAEAWPSWEIHPASPWNYGLIYDPAKSLESQFAIEKREFPEDNYPFTNDAAPIVLKTTGRQIPAWGLDQHWLCGILPESPVTSTSPVTELTLVPMGGARLRISAFPVIR